MSRPFDSRPMPVRIWEFTLDTRLSDVAFGPNQLRMLFARMFRKAVATRADAYRNGVTKHMEYIIITCTHKCRTRASGACATSTGSLDSINNRDFVRKRVMQAQAADLCAGSRLDRSLLSQALAHSRGPHSLNVMFVINYAHESSASACPPACQPACLRICAPGRRA